MYLVELRPGKEELYRTGDELAAAIRSGDVDMHSRIYHRATSKWISVTLHPQYKAIVSERPAAPPMPPLERSTWTFFNDSADTLAGANDPAPGTAGKDGDTESTDPNHPNTDHAWRRPLALSITGGLLILGMQLAASGPKPPWAVHEARVVPADQLRPATAPLAPRTGPIVSLATNHTVWSEREPAYESAAAIAPATMPATVPAVADTTPAPLLPAAPRVRTKALLKEMMPLSAKTSSADAATATATGLVQRWAAAHDSARARLESGIRVTRLNQLFAPTRLSPSGGVTETRMSLAGLANFVRVYREQQAAIEREYQDSFTATSKAHAWTPAEVRVWYTKPARKDPPALAAMTSSLIARLDSLLGVLDAQAGSYTVTRNTIRFEDAGAAHEYAALREGIVATVDSARAVGGADHPGPMSYLLQAIGTTRLPLAI